jgi:hypothetical protein
MEEKRYACGMLAGRQEGEALHLEDPGVDGEIILKWVLWSSSAGFIWFTKVSCSWPF